MAKPATSKPPREALQPEEILCDYCIAKCCRYFALPIDEPKKRKDFDYIRWYLLHERATVFTEDEVWYLLVHTKCRHLQDDHRCGIYNTRPQICRDYSTSNCEYEDDWTYDQYFETPEQVEEFAEAFLPRYAGRRGAPNPNCCPSYNSRLCAMAPLIPPRTLKGFRDYLPEAMMPRERLIAVAQRIYRSYGFSPIDTPALEYLEILTGKGSDETDRQLYQFEDHGGRRVGMRFDLTVPLARFAAQHFPALGLPFKRYHIAPVWRGENTQRGRYREFLQCDFDTIGTQSVAADIETALVIHDLMQSIGFTRFTIRLNNRQLLNGLLEKQGLEGRSTTILRCLDKLAKIGREKVIAEMVDGSGISTTQAESILRLSELEGSNDAILDEARSLVEGNSLGEAGIERLAKVLTGVKAAGVAEARIRMDVAIARGLDYYTGVIYETFLDELPGIGSVCSGGRYDNLAGLFTKQHLPGVGASLGLDRLLAAMEELGLLEKSRTPADVFIAFFDRQRLEDYLRLAARLRSAGIAVEVYPDPKKLGQQLKYADGRGFPLAIIAGENEFAAGTCQLKDLRQAASQEISLVEGTEGLVAAIREILGESDDPAR